MTEIFVNNFGAWFELGFQGVPPSTRAWDPNSYINKGIRDVVQLTGSADTSANMATQAQLNNGSSPIRGSNAPGYSVVINGDSYGNPIYIVPTPNHPRVPVYVYKTQTAHPDSWPPTGIYPGPQQATLASVPVPVGGDLTTPFEVYYNKMIQAPGSDRHAAIYDPWHDEYWDFQGFRTCNTAGSTLGAPQGTYGPPVGQTGYFYACSQGGYIANVRKNYTYPLLSDGSIGGPAASRIPLYATTILHDDIVRGVIPHVIGIAIVCENSHVAPALSGDRTSGVGPSNLWNNDDQQYDYTYAVPLGALYRIDPTWVLPPEGDLISAHSDLAQINLGSNSGQRITKWHLMLWKAMRDYGIVLVDWSGAIGAIYQGSASLDTIYSSHTSAQMAAAWAATGGNLSSPGGALGTAPWSRLQQVVYP